MDHLPYTEEIETLNAKFIGRSGRAMSRHDLWRALGRLRKASRLVRKQR